MAKVKDSVYDMDGWEDAKAAAQDLETSLMKLNAERVKYAELYFMDTQEAFKNPAVVETISPRGHNKVQGATRLLTSTSPQFSLPRQRNTANVDQESDKLEKLANLMWTRSNKLQGSKIEKDLAFTGFLFDEMHVQIVSTRDLVDAANDGLKKAGDKEKKKWEGRVRAAEEIAAFTPYLFESINPMYGIGMRGRLGMTSYLKKVDRNAVDVWNEWGERAVELKGKKTTVTYMEYWDEVNRYVWVTGMSTPILAEPHGLSFIPVETIVAEGSDLFDTETRQREPLLYGALKSGIARSESLMLTALMTNVKELINAGFVFKQGNEGQELEMIQHNVIGNVISAPPGSDLKPLMKEILNPDAVRMMDMINQIYTESTLYDQALGQPISGVDNFSMVSLLAQAGRLPLISVKENMQILLAAVMKKAFLWLKGDGKQYTTRTKARDVLEINPQDIPDYLEWDVSVEPDLPQDKMQMASLADLISKGDRPLVSQAWARENILNIGQSGDMQEEIWTEQAAYVRAGMAMKSFMEMMSAMKSRPAPEVPGAQAGGQAPDMNEPMTPPTGSAPPMEPIPPMEPMAAGQTPPRGGGGAA